MPKTTNTLVRSLPSVDAVLKTPEIQELVKKHGRVSVTEAIRTCVDRQRKAMLKDKKGKLVDSTPAAMAASVAQYMTESGRNHLRRVVNATGIILHTGLGRAVLPVTAREALTNAAGYCNLQQDLHSGRRDHREECLRDIMQELTGAEDVLVVNNNAGATLLVLAALARGKEVVISRGELIEIGGSFRLPDIMTESGAVLREIGTTNKTHLKDYENAIGPRTGMIMKAHKSNYAIVGFSKEVSINDIVKVGRKHKVTVIDDLGCGALVGLEQYGMGHECTVRESLQAGSEVVLFSGDKLIGGPQCGIIAGRADLIEIIRSHPLYRVLRVCKLTVSALEATLRLFKAPDLLAEKHPVYQMIVKTPEAMKKQAEELSKLIIQKCANWEIETSEDISYLGGGTLPGAELQSITLRIKVRGIPADKLALQFRTADTPVIPRIAEGHVIMDMRTVFPEELSDILRAVEQINASCKKEA